MYRLKHSRVLARSPRLVSLALFSLLLCLPLVAHAQRRDFAASYRLGDATETNEGMTLTIYLTIHNFSGSDIHNGGVALYESTAPFSKPVDAFNAIKLLPNHGSVTVSRDFTISKAEYERWNEGQDPNLRFLMSDGAGGSKYAAIDLDRQINPVASIAK